MKRYPAIVMSLLLVISLPLCAATVAYIDIGQRREYDPDNLMDPGQILQGHVSVKEGVKSQQVALLWRDAFGRIAGADTVRISAPNYAADFAIQLHHPLSYYNRLETTLDGEVQHASVEFFIRQPPRKWSDYYAAVWAGYQYEYLDSLRAAGINTHMIYKDFPYYTQVMAAGFNTYVDNICWRVFSPYHKWRHRWNSIKQKVAADPYNMSLLVRIPSYQDPATDEAIRTTVQQVVRHHAPHRPIFFNLADEIGIGDQSGPIDFDHSIFARQAFINWLDKEYGSVEALNDEWGTQYSSYYEAAQSQSTLTDATMDAIWSSQLPRSLKSLSQAAARFGIELGSFEAYVKLNARLKSTPPKTGEQLEKMLPRLKREFGLAELSADQLSNYAAEFDKWTKSLSVAVPNDWNLSAWMDHKDFMDKSMADAMGRAYAYAREVDPYGVFGFTGGHSPGAFAGYNMEYLSRVVDLQVPYNIADDVEILRSLNKNMILMSPTWGRDESGVRRLWYQFFHGDQGVIFWDNDERGNKFIDKNTGAPTNRAKVFRKDLAELTSGIGSLIIASERQHDKIAVLYSHPSIRAQWMIQNLDLGKDWITRQSWEEFRTLGSNALRVSLLKLIEDHHYQYDFISYKQLEDGVLRKGEYKLLFLPQTIAVSDKEVNELENFVAGGGMLVGDNRIGLMDQRGKCRDKGALDHVFGIHWNGEQISSGLPVVEPAGAITRDAGGRKIFVNQYGSGKAVYLNASLMDYYYQRFEPGEGKNLYDLFGDLFSMLGFHPPAKLTRADGSYLPATELVRYQNGDLETWVIFRNARTSNYSADGSIQVKSTSFEQPEQARLSLPADSYVYDIRGGRYLGRKSALEFELDPWRPTMLTVSPRKLGTLTVRTSSGTVVPGEEVTLNIAIGGQVPLANRPTEVVHVGIVRPDGRRARDYEANLEFKGTTVTYKIPFAVNDPQGSWSVTVSHPASAQKSTVTVELKE